jgi:hypothetical protein
MCAGRTSDVSASVGASRIEIGVVYFAGIVQGLALVTFPAASSVFTRPDGFGFDSTRYGAMFVPQVVLAVLASGLAPTLARRWNLRRVLLVGIAGDIASMALLALSRLLLGAPDMAFGVVLVATGALGLGFGATVMRSTPTPRRSSRGALTARSWRSMRCSGWAPPWHRCWWPSLSAWAHGGCSPSWWRASSC